MTNRERGIFVNRTLNLRSIQAIGYDMDYTLIHYKVDEWEQLAYDHARSILSVAGWPVDHLEFDPRSVIRGLALDLAEGNLLKATRFGYVIRAAHGTRLLDYGETRRVYQGIGVDLADRRFVFLNTLFSLSEAALFGQLVDLLDAGEIPAVTGYDGLYRILRDSLEEVHSVGVLKRQIAADPERFVEPDPDIVPTLLDQRHAGKRLMLITNSEWEYSQHMMAHAVDPYLPDAMTWRDLFDTVIVSAVKPHFFTSRRPLYKVVHEDGGLLQPHVGSIQPGSAFHGGCASQVEESLGLTGDEILYVGDHLFGDVHVSKDELRWRTALILREMESEVAAQRAFDRDQSRLEALMAEKSALEDELAVRRLADQRHRIGYAAEPEGVGVRSADEIRRELETLDETISPLAVAAGGLRNELWGPLMRAGIDKSLFARQVERYADVYTSRVSNFLGPGPFAMFRAGRLPLPHD
jgi:5'-nucleotidase